MGITQLNFEGKNKIEVAIDRLREYEPPEGYYLAFSGGKDSVVIYDLAVKSGVKFDAHYCVSPIDPPEIHRFIKGNYPQVTWDYHARGFWKLVHKKGLPLRIARWCCQVIKEAGGENRVVIVGNRTEEGTIRKHQREFERGRKKVFVRPIIDWKEDEVWAYIQMYNLPYCSLYDEGFTRLGCVLCPFISMRRTLLEIERFPKIAKLWRLACNHIMERRLASNSKNKHGFKTGQELWNWWISRGEKWIGNEEAMMLWQ